MASNGTTARLPNFRMVDARKIPSLSLKLCTSDDETCLKYPRGTTVPDGK
jgi:hypothetical protein